ncbi:glycosyltransferase [Phaeacidiphilus oryzae]|uniref:glycosyltransferase n=1 Tax=Phaeacidiphilus oryzae TaxID=348818 RepID=UPI001376CC3A|nr:glycosyltransferase [Phaeacidiphilus oryzae]
MDDEILRMCRRPPVELEVIIPALNEEWRLPDTLSQVIGHLSTLAWPSAVVVVDNGSVDRTAETIDRFRNETVRVFAIGCSERGKGAAVRRGILTSSAKFLGFIDADNATPITAVDDALQLLHAGYDAAIASRHALGARYEVEQPLVRRGGSWLFRRIVRMSLPEFTDTQCGFKFFDGRLVREIAAGCRIDGFAFDVEMLVRMVRAGHTFAEVPVAWSDVAGSTFSVRRDALRTMADLLRISAPGGLK